MDALKKIIVATTLLAATGTSWASSFLSAPTISPPGSTTIVYILLLFSQGGPTPPICNKVNVETFAAPINGINSNGSIHTETVNIELESIDSTEIELHHAHKIFIPNLVGQTESKSFEFKLSPPEAEVCNFVISTQVVSYDGTPLGAPQIITNSIEKTLSLTNTPR